MEFAAVALPLALGVIMFGLGLDLTPGDFARVARQPKAAGVALACQLLLLPALCFALVLLFRLPPILAVGMMLLAASPGGTTANLYSHLFRGDVALNISLTAINSVIAVVTLPVITNLAIAFFQPGDLSVGLQFKKTLEVFLIVLAPVALGMTVRALKPAFAKAMDKPVRIASVAILALVIAGAAVNSFDLLASNFACWAGSRSPSAVSAWRSATSCPACCGSNSRRPSPAPSRSAFTTPPSPSSSPRRCWGGRTCRCRLRSTGC